LLKLARYTFIPAVLLLSFAFSCNSSSNTNKAPARSHADSINLLLSEFAAPLGKPQPGEWRESFQEEYQSYADYVDAKPEGPTAKRNTIYIQPIGEFDSLHEQIIAITAEYMSRFFHLEVKVNKALSSSIIPDEAERMNNGTRQVLTGYVMDKILAPTKPADATVFIAFTTFDLYPQESWNFVFGEASPKKRVGVWSLARFGDPSKSKDDFLTSLVHTLKTATHETGHMFGLDHCTKNRCNMDGSNSLEESLKQPLWLCPECLCKICYCLHLKEEAHLQGLLDFWKARNEPLMVEVYEKMLKALKGR
jgi:archaemetzincin